MNPSTLPRHLFPRFARTAMALAVCAIGSQTQAATPSESDEASATSQLQAITVTAQRRDQKISDVPISVTAITGDALAERGVSALHEVATQVPGVQIYRNAQGQPTWIIRGVGLIDFSPNNTPTAAVYQDDVYQVSNALSQLSLFDVARVEVLKGPQGGIYGRNTSGGAVRVISNLAEFGATEGEAKLSWGTWNTVRAGASVAGTLVKGVLAGRLAVDATGGGDERLALLSNGGHWGRQDKTAVRASLLWQASPNARWTASLETGRDASQLLAQNAIGYASTSGKPPGYWCAAVLGGNLDNNNCLTYGGFVNTVAYKKPGTNNPGTQTPAESVLADPFGKFDITSNGLTLNGDIKLGDMKLVSVTHVRDFDFGRSSDSDAVQGEFAHQVAMSKFKVFSQELRLHSTPRTDMRWVIGASFMRDELKEDRTFYFRDNAVYLNSFKAYGVTRLSELAARLAYDQETRSGSVFAQADYALGATTNVGVALRWTDERKNYRHGGFGFPLSTGAVAPAVATIAGYQLEADYKLQAPWSGKVSVDWKPSKGLMTYASVSRGFKVGGFFGGFPLNGQAAILPYKEEGVVAYELGLKTDAANRVWGANAALYHYNYSDAQNFTTVFSPLLSRTVVRLDNVGRAAHDGLDLDGWWRPVPALKLTAGLNLLNARFLDDFKYVTLDSQVVSYQGQKRPYAPARSWTFGAEYEWTLASGNLRLGLDVNGRSDIMQSFGSAVDRAITSLPGYTLTDLRAVFTNLDSSLQYSVVVRNATDRRYALTYSNDGLGSYSRYYGEPRSIRAEVSYRF